MRPDNDTFQHRREQLSPISDIELRPRFQDLARRQAAGEHDLAAQRISRRGRGVEPSATDAKPALERFFAGDHQSVRPDIGVKVGSGKLDLGQRCGQPGVRQSGIDRKLLSLERGQECLLDERLDDSGQHRDRLRALPRGVDAAAAVHDEPLAVAVTHRVDLCEVPATAAPDKARQKRGMTRAGARQSSRYLRSVPFGLADERWVSADGDELAGACFAEVHPVSDQSIDGSGTPLKIAIGRHDAGLGEELAEPSPACARRAFTEELADNVSVAAWFQSAIPEPLVARRSLRRDMDTPVDGAFAREVPVGAATVEFPFRDRSEHVRDELPVRCDHVESDIDGDEVPAIGERTLEQRPEIRQGACDPVELRRDDPVRLAAIDSFECGSQPWSVQARPWLVEVFLPTDDHVAARSRVRLDLVTLHLRADETLAGAATDAAHPDAADQSHSLVSARSAGAESLVRRTGPFVIRRAASRIRAEQAA